MVTVFKSRCSQKDPTTLSERARSFIVLICTESDHTEWRNRGSSENMSKVEMTVRFIYTARIWRLCDMIGTKIAEAIDQQRHSGTCCIYHRFDTKSSHKTLQRTAFLNIACSSIRPHDDEGEHCTTTVIINSLYLQHNNKSFFIFYLFKFVHMRHSIRCSANGNNVLISKRVTFERIQRLQLARILETIERKETTEPRRRYN